MAQLQKTTALLAALHAAMAITKWTTSVSLISVQAVKPNAQTTAQQAKNKYVMAACGGTRTIVRTVTHATVRKQTAAAV